MSNYKATILELFKQKSFPNNPQHCVHNLLGNKKIILYGGGQLGVSFLVRVSSRYKLKIHTVLDRKFKSGDNFYGIPAFSPLEYKPTKEEKEYAVVVVAVHKKKYLKEIYNCLGNLGFKNIISVIDIYELQLCCVPTELEKKGFNYYLDSKKRIIACLELFKDDLSCEIFTRFLQTHMQRKPVDIPHRPLEEQYFPRDIQLSKGYSRFVNCGAYNGDTVKRLNALFGKVDAIACFEPDPGNFELLTQYLCTKHNEIAKIVIAFPCGVFSNETQFYFSRARASSTISDKGEFLIQCTALDHVLVDFNPTFISMDVEGAELEALKGAERLIKENKPDLAISVYHSPNHIWDIPLYLKSLHLGYKFYLRNYTSFTNETILYATT